MSTDTTEEVGRIVQAITLEVSKMTLAKGDTLVVKVNQKLSRLQRESVYRQVSSHVPLNGAKCIVLESYMSMAVTRPPKKVSV